VKKSGPIFRRLAGPLAAAGLVMLDQAAAAAYHSALDTAFSPDGTTLAVIDATTPSLVLLDPASAKITRTVNLAGPPAGVAWAGDGKHLFVSESGTHRIAEIDPASGAITRRFNTVRYPRGLAVTKNSGLLLATDWGRDRLAIIDIASGTTKALVATGRQPTCVAVTPDETLALVSNLIPSTAATAPGHAAEISVIDLQTLKPRSPIKLPLGSTNTCGIAISNDGSSAYVVHTLGRFNLPTTQLDRGWVNTNALSVIDVRGNKLTATLLLDQVMDGAADPWGVAIDPAGRRLYVTLAGVHQLAVIDLEKLPELLKTNPDSLMSDLAALHRGNLIRRIDLPAKGPRGLAVSPDGRTLAIAGYFSGDLVLTDSGVSNPATLALGSAREPDLVRQGEFIFHDSNRCFQRWLSCASCHPDARADGLNWDLLNDGLGNPKNARSMLWADRTPPMMSLAVREDMDTAIKAGFVHIQFVEPKDQEIRAVSAYLKSLRPAPSPHLNEDGSLTESAKRGEALFNSPAQSCSQCHPQPLLTDLKTYDVGTANANDREHKVFDTPALAEAWRSPPYLHDGSAPTLKDVITRHNTGDQHGSTSRLDSQQIEDLAAYLESL
jgi:DNA-binding beta-propeller fold protein YncE